MALWIKKKKTKKGVRVVFYFSSVSPSQWRMWEKDVK